MRVYCGVYWCIWLSTTARGCCVLFSNCVACYEFDVKKQHILFHHKSIYLNKSLRADKYCCNLKTIEIASYQIKMEPMTLGSAPSSPASPGLNPNFLPAFLMGDNSQPNTPGSNVSPGRNRNPNQMRRMVASNTPQMYPKMFNQSVMESPIPSKQPFVSHKPGPPSQGLFDTIEQKRKPTSPILNSTAVPLNDSPVAFGRSISRVNEDSNYSRHLQHDSLNATASFSRMERIDTHWVTVFGFPPSALSVVIAQLSNCGVIVEKKIPTQGNWLHVKFNNLGDVPRALALNGRCINHCIMIGVNLHYDKENKENECVIQSPTRARSLRQSFVTQNTTNSVLPPQNVPQRSTGMVSKAIEYVFGW